MKAEICEQIRCDNASPACSQCAGTSLQCTFTPRTAKRGRPSVVLKQIQDEQNQKADVTTTEQDLSWLLDTSTVTAGPSPAFEQPSFYSPPAVSATVAPVQAEPQPTPSTSARPRRARSTDEIAPRATIAALIDFWFSYWHSFVPCLDQPKFMASFEARQDAHDQSFFSLLLALCSATCTCSHRLPMIPDLGARYATWEDAARRFNASMPPARTREMFQLSDVSVVQNIILVSVYELAIGSSLAFHLVIGLPYQSFKAEVDLITR